MSRVPKPPVVERHILNKIVGVGRDPDQTRKIVGTVHHTMEGNLRGTDQWFRAPAIASLTDYGIGGTADGALDGIIYEWIAPTAKVVPWANGRVADACAPYGDAPAFLSAYGVAGVNTRLRSIETSDGGNANAGKSLKQIDALAWLTAWIHSEQAGQTADSFAWQLQHREFGVAHQQCPGKFIVDNRAAITARAKAIIRAYATDTPLATPLLITYPAVWQGGEIPQPGNGTVPKPETTTAAPVGPDPTSYPPGLDRAIAERLFGKLERGGRVLSFNPTGPVSQLWLKVGGKYGYPEISDVWITQEGAEYIRFCQLVIWRPSSRHSFAVLGEVN